MGELSDYHFLFMLHGLQRFILGGQSLNFKFSYRKQNEHLAKQFVINVSILFYFLFLFLN
jgi:hypothetical protein